MTSINHPSIKSITKYHTYHGILSLLNHRAGVVGHAPMEARARKAPALRFSGKSNKYGHKITCFSPSKGRGEKRNPLTLWRGKACKISDSITCGLTSGARQGSTVWLAGAYFDAIEGQR